MSERYKIIYGNGTNSFEVEYDMTDEQLLGFILMSYGNNDSVDPYIKIIRNRDRKEIDTKQILETTPYLLGSEKVPDLATAYEDGRKYRDNWVETINSAEFKRFGDDDPVITFDDIKFPYSVLFSDEYGKYWTLVQFRSPQEFLGGAILYNRLMKRNYKDYIYYPHEGQDEMKIVL